MNRRPRRPRRLARHIPVLVESSTKLTPKEFTLLGIEKLRFAPGRAVHAVYSGFNAAFRAYFPDLDVVEEMQTLAEAGVIVIIPARTGGVSINTPNAPNILRNVPAPAVKALVTMGLAS
jgi:hypothetical protein